MPFKIKAIVVDFAGDEEKYPCHFQYKIGDEIIYDGEQYLGKVCPAILGTLGQNFERMFELGPRATGPGHYFPFWYAPPSAKDPGKKMLDGKGFATVFQTHIEPKHHMANLIPPNAYQWPPYQGPIGKDVTVTCPDLRTAAIFLLQAVDLADKGYIVPFFRRQMAILHKVANKQGVGIDMILNEFTEAERLDAYPPITKEIIPPLVEDMALLDFLKIEEKNLYVTDRGIKRLDKFKKTLSKEEIRLLRLK